ncbi:MFS transporter [Duganella sp. FT109W]|uniref:MFS transporter n=1 Tax=Duganella margarita TaxID=2692170 RepID=A0ABW9WDH9_9BURK|nr:MFS transporter [Duganella margarita]
MAATRPGTAIVLAAVICNGLEFFDFVAYAFFAQTIGKVFFPGAGSALALLLAVGVFGVGFIARPLGSIVIGRYADRAGRRPALLLSAVLMTLGTVALMLTPGYASIGLYAPLLITLCRLVQGFALGGETGPATAFLLESAPPHQRATYVALQMGSQGIATALAGGLGMGLALSLSAAQMQDWGWRVPFAISTLLIPVALYLRFQMPETLPSQAGAASAATHHAGRLLWRSQHVVLGILVIAGGTVSTYIGSYMTTYGATVLHLPPADALQTAIATGLTMLAGALLGGHLADRYGRWPLMFWPRLATALVCLPMFSWLIAHPHAMALQLISATLALLTALTAGAVLTTICELFPATQRAAALALIYSVGVSLFGGSAQFVVTWLIALTGDPMAPAWCIAATSIAALVATWRLPETGRSQLTTSANSTR